LAARRAGGEEKKTPFKKKNSNSVVEYTKHDNKTNRKGKIRQRISTKKANCNEQKDLYKERPVLPGGVVK